MWPPGVSIGITDLVQAKVDGGRFEGECGNEIQVERITFSRTFAVKVYN